MPDRAALDTDYEREPRTGYYFVARGGTAAMNTIVLYTCITCGSLVEGEAVPRHDAWHAHLDESTTEAP